MQINKEGASVVSMGPHPIQSPSVNVTPECLLTESKYYIKLSKFQVEIIFLHERAKSRITRKVRMTNEQIIPAAPSISCQGF